jgi:hypothetical protein
MFESMRSVIFYTLYMYTVKSEYSRLQSYCCSNGCCLLMNAVRCVCIHQVMHNVMCLALLRAHVQL